MSDQIRYPAGVLGTYYATRHALKAYRSCAVTATYSVPADTALPQLLSSALRLNVETHPILRYGLSDPPDPAFILQNNIKLSSVLDILPAAVWTSDDRAVTQVLEQAHRELFTDPESNPSWRVRVLPYEATGLNRKIEVIFLAHHAISDGLSCLAFHTSLLTHLQTCVRNNIQEQGEVYQVPRDSAGPDPIENHVFFHLQDPEPAINITDAILPISVPAWPNMPCPVATSEDYQSRVLLLKIPPVELNRALTYSKTNGITLTALLHGMLTAQLTRLLPDAQSFAAICPYSMRSFTVTPNTNIVNHVSYTKHTWSVDLISALRKTAEGSEEEMGIVLMTARLYCAEIAAELGKCPQGNPWCKLAAVDDVLGYCKAAITATRTFSYELSNLGVAKFTESVAPENDTCRGGVTIDRCIFTQCGMIDPPIGINTVSHEGSLILSFTWRQGAVAEEVMVGLREGIARCFTTLGYNKE